MPITRAPRKILTSWVENPQPLGCQQMNWGRALKKGGARLGRELFWRGLVGCSSCRGSGNHSTCLEAPRTRQDVEVNRKGDANPAHLPRLGSSFARGFARVILDRVRGNWITRPALAIGGASSTLKHPPSPAPVILLT
jgi:hypothetical protein